MSSVVIIGASHAAAEAISTLKKLGFDGSVTLIGDEPYLPYQRPPLSKKYFNDEVTVEQLYIRGPQTYDDFGVIQKLGTRATRIDRQQKVVELENGERVQYDKLMIATGTRARLLPIEGADRPQVKYLRTKQNVDEIKALTPEGAKLLVIGAGYIGLEVAASAVKRGVSVVVLEAMDRVLQRVTGPQVSAFYQQVHAEEGVDIRLNTTVQRFVEIGEALQAQLGDGSMIDFDCAVVGIGVIPNVELAEEAGLPCDNGIVVDEFCRTVDHDIYAVGDCSNHPNFTYDCNLRLESVPNAMAQAKTAAMSICGNNQRYDEIPWFWSDQYDVKLQTTGLCGGFDQAVLRGDPGLRKFAVFYLREGRLLAVDAINSPAEFMVSKKLVAAHAHPDPAKLADAEYPMKSFLA